MLSRLEVFWTKDLLFELCLQCSDVLASEGAEAWGLLLGRKISDIEWKIERMHHMKYMVDYEPTETSPLDIGYALKRLPEIMREYGTKKNIEVLGTYHSHPHECDNVELYPSFAPSGPDAKTFQDYGFGINTIVYLVQEDRCTEEQKSKLLTFEFAKLGERVAKAVCYITSWSYDSPNMLPQKIPEPSAICFLVCCGNFSSDKWVILKPTIAGWFTEAVSN